MHYRSVEYRDDPLLGEWITFVVGQEDPRPGRSSKVISIEEKEGHVYVKFEDRRNLSVGPEFYRNLLR